MYFESVAAAIDMAGHGGYVWSAYGITLLVIGWLLLAPRMRLQDLKRQIAGELRRNADVEPIHNDADAGTDAATDVGIPVRGES